MKKKKYEAVGLLEMILAMGVAGIALAVFMTMSTNSMKEAIRYERHDGLTRLAMDGALVVRRHAEVAHDLSSSTTFPTLIVNRCYRLNFSTQRVTTTSTGRHSLKNSTSFRRDIIYDDRQNIREEAYVGYCIENIESTSSRVLYHGSVVTGYGAQYSDISEYEYPVIVVIEDY